MFFHVSCLLFLFLTSQLYFVCASSSHLPSFSSSSISLCHPNQGLALLQFKNTFSIREAASGECDGHGHPKTQSWKEGTNCCKWDGVTCDLVTGHVISLDLGCSQLLGSIHSNSSLLRLIHLQKLNLAHNAFNYNSIPSEFGRFSKMTHLNLSDSVFSGRVPSKISHLSRLVSIDLSQHYGGYLSLEKSVWKGLVQNLTEIREIYLDYVNMSSIGPSSILNLSSTLTSLSLYECELNGKLPDKVLHLRNLHMLNLGGNYELKAYLPKSNWSSPLKHLNLGGMAFSREIPESIGNLKSLLTLRLNECNFSGSIPTSLGTLTHITDLDLSNNHFTGLVPLWLGNLTQINRLGLSSINFNGQIPSFLSNLKALTYLVLSANNFHGRIPSLLSNLKALTYLDLSANNFSGRIPDIFTNLTQLTQVDLSSNLLRGSLPSSLFTLPSLGFLYLSNNQFTGLSDDEFQHNNSLTNLYLDNNKLYSSIPKSISKLVNLKALSLSLNNFSGIVNFDMFSKLKDLWYLDLSFNNISFSVNNDVNYTLPFLRSLYLSFCNMSEFPNFLRNMEGLTNLDLSNNRIYGQIPEWMFDVGKNLTYLILSHNFLSNIKQLPWENLQYLDLRANELQGSFPIPPPRVEFLFFSNNSLIGEIPSLVCNLSSLRILDISYNNLSGTIPQCLGNISDSLSVLDLRMNSFHGPIPKTFPKCDSLRNLNFNGNQLRGSLPRLLVNCSSLEVLDLGNNKINDYFPFWLEALPNLQVLVLRSNRFHGHIGNSNTKFPFPKLRIIDLSYNEFNGPLPTNYFKNFKAMKVAGEGESNLRYMGDNYYQDSVAVTLKGLEVELVGILTTFTTIDLSSNKFQGQIPEVLGSLNFLRLLNLSHNSLTGHIPSSLGNLSELESLDLSSNRLIGKIPMQLTSLTFLAMLNLSKNQLVGPIPQGNQFDTFQNDSYGGNLGLCGFPLSNKCNIDEFPSPSPTSIFQEGNNSGFVSEFGWKVVVLGYGCGMVFGLVMGYVIFKTGKPQWLVRFVEEEQYRMMRSFNRKCRRRRNKCM